MTTAVCLAILATAAIINTIHGNENQALVIQCIIFAVYNIELCVEQHPHSETKCSKKIGAYR